MKLIINSNPHIHNEQDISLIQFYTLLALVPITLMGLFSFGVPALVIILVSVIASIAFEAGINVVKKEPLTIYDGSAALIGLLLALSLPPIFPLWMVILGAFFAVVITKHTFGGYGFSVFHPVAAAYVFLIVSYPPAFATWYEPGTLFHFTAVTGATPLAKSSPHLVHLARLFFGGSGGSIGETSTAAILIGAGFLFREKIIDWKTPISFLGTIALFSIFTRNNPLFQMMVGGAMLGGFFLMTDYSTTPMTKLGRIFFGISAGIVVMCVRLYGHSAEGVAFSVLLLNGLSPLLDKVGVYLHIWLYGYLFPEKKS